MRIKRLSKEQSGLQQGRFIRSLAIRAVRISHLRIKRKRNFIRSLAISFVGNSFLRIKKVTKGMKRTAVGEIYTQSCDLVCRKFVFAYKKDYKRNEVDCGREELYAVSQFAPSGFHICV